MTERSAIVGELLAYVTREGDVAKAALRRVADHFGIAAKKWSAMSLDDLIRLRRYTLGGEVLYLPESVVAPDGGFAEFDPNVDDGIPF